MANTVPSALPVLELDIMKTFIAIAETGNFTTAAEVVFRTPSAVSMQIKKLEDMLRVSLFRRDARSVCLTHHGELLLSYAKRMVALNNEAVSRFVVPEMNGIVRLGAPDDIGELMLPGILRHLSETWPNLAIDVTIESSVNLHRAVEDGRLDLTLYNFLNAVRADPAEKVMTEQLVWVGKRHGQAHLKTPLPISVWDSGCSWRTRALEELTKSQIEFRIAYYCGSHMGQTAAIRADIAIAPLARFLVRDDMVELDDRDGLPDLGSYDIGLAVRQGASQPALAVADYIRAALGDRSFKQLTAVAA
ncbi:LysR family transcriptional regulator [Rhizobium sp. KVB221]|uniref:HTH-type transcriptional regulator TtuA n=1 Tax=Rhizobium setariae TaxID=2801340 RepID=A0A936YS18_9HYPH|nr:LysR family transcriptional regulator [Rhizobium setariae]MBL0373189.1 LysR family transcriptional regulator [Rhizobium setariae]